ncbi:hypothetical protein ACQP25_17865 [Microtetraspora malaysiensis]|uniref:hypothetical protein n=1 Tax=Microtetraspora malaysiensis TaxID=161358 RepID=UPI003D8B0A96
MNGLGFLTRCAAAAGAVVTILATAPSASAADRLTAAAGSSSTAWGCFFAGSSNIEKTMSNKITPRSKQTSKGAVDLRAGWYKGKQHGWARVRSPQSQTQYTVFEVDTNGDRKPDDSWGILARVGTFTCAYPASSSSRLAFRACISTESGDKCTSAAYRTSWW